MDAKNIVPEIDISALIESGSSLEQQQAVLDEIHRACKDIGFMSIINHGIPMELIERTEQAAKDFFHQPRDMKMRLAPKKWNPESINVYRGYIPSTVFGKECLDLADPWRTERQDSELPLTELNQFTDELPTQDQQAVFFEYYEAIYSLTKTLVQAVFRIFNADLKEVDTLFDKKELDATLRFNFYPQHEEGYGAVEISAEDGTKLACETHQDSGFFTVLYQDTVGGLQVQSPVTKQWHDVPCNRKAFVINTGVTMQKLTNDNYKATYHRVKLGHAERLSIPFFYAGSLPYTIDSKVLLPDEEPKYEPISCKDHTLMRNSLFKEYQRN